MNELNKVIRSTEMLLASRKVQQEVMQRRIAYLKLSHKDYRKDKKDLRAWRYESQILYVELKYKKRQLEILKAYMIAGVPICRS